MRILDHQRYWAFVKAYAICFVSLVGLYIVLDAFTNLDEHAELARGTLDLLRRMGRYYGVRLFRFYDELCGVITMMAAIFTVTWMQKDNELIAMLAAGVSTHRVIRPVIVAAALVGGLSVVNQEWIIPPLAEELQRPPDVDANEKLWVRHRTDANEISVNGEWGFPRTRSLEPFAAILPISRFGAMINLEAVEGIYIPPTDRGSPLRGGWLLRGARMTPGDVEWSSPLLIKLEPEDLAGFPRAHRRPDELVGDAYFLHSDATFAEVTRSRQWFYYASTLELIRTLGKKISASERADYAVFLHTRIVRPLSSLMLLFLSLPMVLGGNGRNTFVNLGLSLATSALYYAVAFFVQYLGRNHVITAELAAWIPLIGFGTLAAARWDRIRT